MRDRQSCVYILASGQRGTLYVGVTSDLIQRIWQHRNDVAEGFSKKYKVHELAWFEMHDTMECAIIREKALKEWKRMWKIELIEKSNLSSGTCTRTFSEVNSHVLPAAHLQITMDPGFRRGDE